MRGERVFRRGSGIVRRASWSCIPLLLLTSHLSPQLPPRYTAGLIECVAFAEQVRTEIRNQSGRAVVNDRTGRDGVLLLRATPAGDSVALEAWYDSLAVWRESHDGREAPDTEGLLAGRYRGVLLPDGRFEARAVPFVPDEVAEVADLSRVMEDFLPRLPPVALPPGHDFRDSTGWRVRRLSDATTAGGAAERYEWTGEFQRAATREVAGSDSLEVRLEESHAEQGLLTWSPRLGPLSWSRHIVVNARVPQRGGVRRAVHTVVDQQIWVTRRLEKPGTCEKR